MSSHKSLIITMLLFVVVPLGLVLATPQVAGEDIGRNILRLAREKKTGRKETPPARTAQETRTAVREPVKDETTKTIKTTAAPPVAAVTGAVSGDELLNVLPAGCLVCLRINNLDTTLGAVDEYITGVWPQPVSLAMLAKMQLGQMLGDPTLEGVNLQGDLAVFVTALPGAAAATGALPEIVVGILVPVKGDRTAQNLAAGALPGTNYALIMPEPPETVGACRRHGPGIEDDTGLGLCRYRKSR